MTIDRNAIALHLRRRLVLALAASLSVCVPPLAAQTADKNLRRVGVLAPSTRAKEEIILKPFFDEMRALGWIEGQNIAYDRVFAEDQQQHLPRLAAELVARKPELIYAPPMVSALVAKQATGSIPIVFATGGSDPVSLGLVASYARPGGNVTGVVNNIESLVPKRLELVRELLPNAKRVGILRDPLETWADTSLRSTGRTATALGLTIVWADMSGLAELDGAIAKLTGEGVDVIFANSTIASNLRAQLVELASRKRVPVVVNRPAQMASGALFGYGSSQADQLRRSGQLADKILKGARPADIPVEQPTRFELGVNLRAARALGITIPRAVLLRADEVVQ